MEYAIVGILLIGALAFGAVSIVLARILQRHNPYPGKLLTYECGMMPEGLAWVGFRMSYFLYALVFLVFDIEVIFLYPWALVFKQLGLFGIVEMFIFLTIMIVGYLYAWKEGAFEWL